MPYSVYRYGAVLVLRHLASPRLVLSCPSRRFWFSGLLSAVLPRVVLADLEILCPHKVYHDIVYIAQLEPLGRNHQIPFVTTVREIVHFSRLLPKASSSPYAALRFLSLLASLSACLV